jgi:hypothetical protein
MFDMSKSKKKKKVAEWNFDLENDLKDPVAVKKIKGQIDDQVGRLKTLLREGGDKKTFDDAQTLLHGYLAVQKVLQRIGR